MKKSKIIRNCFYQMLVLLFVSVRLFAQQNEPGLIDSLEWEAEGELTMSIENDIRTLNLNENVVIYQGTLEILGDSAVIEYDVPTGEFLKATVFGSPVNYSQELSEAGSSVKGTSDSIEFFSDESTGYQTVELTGNAFIESPDSTISCAEIVYLPDLDLIPNTTGPCAGSFSQ